MNIHMPKTLSGSVLPFLVNNRMPINMAKNVPMEKNVVIFSLDIVLIQIYEKQIQLSYLYLGCVFTFIFNP